MAIYRSLGTVKSLIEGFDWPGDFVMPDNLLEFLNRIYVIDYRAANVTGGKKVTLWLAFEGELSVALPGLDGVKLVALGGDTEGLTFVTAIIESGDQKALRLQGLRFSLRFDPSILKPAALEEGGSVAEFVEIRVEGSIHINSDFDISISGFDALELTPAMIGDSGIVIAAQDVKFDLLRTSAIPEVLAAGFDESFIGVYIGEATVKLPEGYPALVPEDLVLKNAAIGSGGVSGRLEAHYSPVYNSATKTFTGNGAGALFGIPFGLKDVELEFKQNTFLKSEIKGALLLPFFDEPVEVDIGIDLDGDFTVSLTSAGQNGLYKLTKPNILEIELDSIGFELKDGVFLAKLSGQITPLVGANQGLDWPGFKVEELSIDSQGNVRLKGGWLALREQYSLKFHGFEIGITRIGFGKTEDGGKWVGFSGDLKLVDGFTAGASVEGLRVTWYEDGRDPKISFNGIGVEFEIPEVLKFKGFVSYRELEVDGASVHRFDGDITLSLISLKLEIDAKLVIGSASGGPEGRYNFFAIYLGVELPTGIPLSPTPLALYGMAGLFALQLEPNKTAGEEWYEGWYKRPDVGVTDLESKWVNRRGSLALGIGATIGTSDNGFTFSCKGLLVLVFPGPLILFEARSNLLKERAKLNDDPLFRTLAVIDLRQNQISMSLDARYKQDESGRVIDIIAGAKAFFANPGNWHVKMGEPSNRIRARILSLFEANAYFMIDPKRLATGAWVGFARRWKFGPVSLTMEAWIEGNAVVNWKPLHFCGELGLGGSIEVRVFGFGLGLSVEARFAAEVFDPFHVLAKFAVSFRLPRPLKKNKRFEITLEWGPEPNWPAHLPLPLKEVAVEHFKVTTSWPLPKNSTPPLLVPRYDPDKEGMRNYNPPPSFNEPPIAAMPVVPLDCRPHISFGRPVHDDALVGVNPQPVQPAFELIGDQEKGKGSARVRYGLSEIELAKRDPQTNLWQAVAKSPVASGIPALYGSWAAVPQLPSGMGQPSVANDKLWLWSKMAFEYPGHGAGDWNNWLIGNEAFANYPCVSQDIPDREVCVDFERLGTAQRLESPWQVPEQPEITLSWQAPPLLPVTVLDSPSNGFSQALSFPALTNLDDAIRNTVTINLSTPAKQIKLLLVEEQPERVRLDFRNRTPGRVPMPLVELGVTFATGRGLIEATSTTLGNWKGLICPESLTALDDMTITLPRSATAVELMLSYRIVKDEFVPPLVTALDSAETTVSEKRLINPAEQPEIVRFEGTDLKQIKINAGNVRLYLHELCFISAATATVTATAFDAAGVPLGNFVNQGSVMEIVREGVARVEMQSEGGIQLVQICTLFGPDPAEVDHRQDMEDHLRSEVVRWSQAGEVLDPFSTYRLKIVTTIQAQGVGKLSGTRNLTQTEFAYFRTEGPPGLTKLSLPVGRDPVRDADKFDSGLEDLSRYVRQTTPATIPAAGEKPVMAKPFYRAYDIGLDFNEDYVDLMYRIGGRDLGLYLYDNNNQLVRDAQGRIIVQSGDWGAVEELILTDDEQQWLALSGSPQRCLPLIDDESIVHDKKLTSAIADRLLEPDRVHEARLTPLLLREDFRDYAVGTQTQGPTGRLGRWEVRDDGDINGPSRWEVREQGTPLVRYLVQTSSIKGGPEDPANPFKPGTILVYGADPALDAGHSEQPSKWTDYRLSVSMSADGGGAMGIVFRVRNPINYYRFSMDRNGQYRRLVRVANGIHTVLAQDDFIYESQLEYLLTVEAIGNVLRIYQDGAPVFEVTDAAHSQGSIGLYCHNNPNTWFNDVRVDDFRQTAPVLYRFEFTTSLFANFFHHLHSYQDETWRVAVENVAQSVVNSLLKAVSASAPVSVEEGRAYETLTTALLGPRARQDLFEVQVSRVEIDGTPLAFLIQGPEPIDWSRAEFALSRTSLVHTGPAQPGEAKIAGVNFATNRIDLDSVVLLSREPMDLMGYRIESRLATWPLNLESGVVIDASTLSGAELPQHEWTTYRELEIGKVSAGKSLQVTPGDAAPVTQLVGVDAGSVEPTHRIFYSVELRLVAPDGEVVHTRHFLPDDDYVNEDVSVLRKADGTGFFMVKLDAGGPSVIPFPTGQYRMHLTYHRNNKTRVPASQILSQAGSDADEIVTLDIPLQTQD